MSCRSRLRGISRLQLWRARGVRQVLAAPARPHDHRDRVAPNSGGSVLHLVHVTPRDPDCGPTQLWLVRTPGTQL